MTHREIRPRARASRAVGTLAAALLLAACGRDAGRAADTAAGVPSATTPASGPARPTTLWLVAPPGDTAAVGPATSERELVARFGATNVGRDTIQVGEGFTEPGTVLFPDDSRRRLEILWADTLTRDRPARVRAGGSAWVAHPGVRLGLPLAEVERLNGRAFTMTGFGWDYGGTVLSWDGGRLDSLPPGVTRLLVRFDHPRDPPVSEDEERRVSGEGRIPSSDPIMRRMQPYVYHVEVLFQ